MPVWIGVCPRAWMMKGEATCSAPMEAPALISARRSIPTETPLRYMLILLLVFYGEKRRANFRRGERVRRNMIIDVARSEEVSAPRRVGAYRPLRLVVPARRRPSQGQSAVALTRAVAALRVRCSMAALKACTSGTFG